MDDLDTPRGLAGRAKRHAREGMDLADILNGRGERWHLAEQLLGKSNESIGAFVQAAELAVAASPPGASAGRMGGYILTFTGIRFWPLDPRPEDVCPVDIAHALAAKARFGGHTKRVYNVAAHSLRVANMAQVMAEKEHEDGKLAFAYGLIHDGNEAYLPDIPSPLKPFSEG